MISKKLFPIIIFIYFFQYASERNLNYFNFQKVSKKNVLMQRPSIKKSLVYIAFSFDKRDEHFRREYIFFPHLQMEIFFYLTYRPNLNTKSCISLPLCGTLKFENLRIIRQLFSADTKCFQKILNVFFAPENIKNILKNCS